LFPQYLRNHPALFRQLRELIAGKVFKLGGGDRAVIADDADRSSFGPRHDVRRKPRLSTLAQTREISSTVARACMTTSVASHSCKSNVT
jgi:hypothetical protein